MRPAYCFVCALAIVSAGAGRAAAPPSPFLPVKAWSVDYRVDQRVAARDYSNGKRVITFGLESRPLGKGMELVVLAPTKSWGMETGIKSKINFGDRERDQEATAYPATKRAHTIYSYTVDAEALAELARSERLKIKVRSLSADLPLDGAAKVLKALHECDADLLESWGFSRDAQAQMASPPKPLNGMHLLHSADYPKSAVDRLAVGDVQARLSVDANGTATGCTLTKSSGHKDIDAAVCKSVMKRARFHPALDHAGRPMAALYFLASSWRITG